MITIPSSIAYFVLGFISCFALVVIICISIVRNENKKRQEITDMIIKSFADNEIKNKDEDEDKDE